ncbi:MAG: RebB family R body protein [Kofleriaceae bacterium]
MARKVVVTETVTAELMPARDEPPPPPPPPPEPPCAGRAGATAGGGEADVGVLVVGVTAAMSLGEQMLALAHGLALSSHNATSAQSTTTTLLGASTTVGVKQLLSAATPAAAVRAPVAARPRGRRS